MRRFQPGIYFHQNQHLDLFLDVFKDSFGGFDFCVKCFVSPAVSIFDLILLKCEDYLNKHPLP